MGPAAHELRNHLQSMLALAEMAEGHVRGRGGRAWLRRFRAATAALRDIGEDWLGGGPTTGVFDPARLLRDLVAAHAPAARRKGLALRCTTARGGPPRAEVEGDRRAFRTLVSNLLGNAIKFTPRGRVTARLSSRRIGVVMTVRLEVADTGAGLPTGAGGDLAALGELSRRRGGSGLGLRLAGAAARTLGGALAATARRGGGARFVANLTLPRAGGGPGRDRGEPTEEAGARRVLVVDDHPLNRRFALSILSSRGHGARGVASAGAALRLARERRFDVAVVDLGLPDQPGEQLARALRRLHPGIRLVGWSGGPRQDDGPFDAWVGKPCSPGALATVIQPAAEDDAFERSARALLGRSGRREGARLAAAARSGEASTMAEAAHRVRGALALAGLRELAELARRAERAAEAGRLGPAARDLAKVSGGLRRLGGGLT